MQDIFQVRFANEQVASAVRVPRSTELSATLQDMGVRIPNRALVLVGGASGMTDEQFMMLRSLFEEVIAPLMESLNASVIDGGTDAGVMKLMGEARQTTKSHFPLIGVAAFGTVILPGDTSPAGDRAPLDENHTHFVLVPGSLWGDEAPWIARVATAIACEQPSVTILVNGGKIAWQDVFNSVRAGRPVLVIAGSGRTADELASAIRGESTSDRATELINTGLLQAIDLTAGGSALAQALESLLNKAANLHPPSSTVQSTNAASTNTAPSKDLS